MANVTIKGIFLIEETDLAMQISVGFKQIWLPRSQVWYMKKGAMTEDGRELSIEVPEWLAKKEKLHCK